MTEPTTPRARAQALLRELRREQRDDKIRAGRVQPRTRHELGVFRDGLRERFDLGEEGQADDQPTEP
ncbi:hypothetical protein SAMN04489727_5732 [Amycolatopsis tolypomycina]|uniref:Uncharacterized protein n=1 Tax=Amycolatopsis tolypomycina TaxID=208445 RepID=A0A1H4WRQ3_9PSEU|nr:hypothetical protein [Amycolatopsis tolypomycina]SEC95234.1 hypothetical protein SAMN04489727_5732 [Amycolatopsis tolypomycina]